MRLTALHALNLYPHLSSFPGPILPFGYVYLSPRPVVFKVEFLELAASPSPERVHIRRSHSGPAASDTLVGPALGFDKPSRGF